MERRVIDVVVGIDSTILIISDMKFIKEEEGIERVQDDYLK